MTANEHDSDHPADDEPTFHPRMHSAYRGHTAIVSHYDCPMVTVTSTRNPLLKEVRRAVRAARLPTRDCA